MTTPSVPNGGRRMAKSGRRASRLVLVGFLGCSCLFAATAAWAGQELDFHVAFQPDELGASTNLSLSAKLVSSTGGPLSPVTKFVLYAPAGMRIDARGAGTCTAAVLKQIGPRGCPIDSRAGFGGGVGALSLPDETIQAPYTLDFFFAPREGGRLRLLIYVSARAPATLELVLVAKEVPAPKPFGLGFSVEVPPIVTFPGAPDASVESAFVTVGSPDVAYYERVHGRRTLVHLRGLIVPQHCPTGGFPTEGKAYFADGTTLTVNPTIPCPSR
ncbi:MAG TPA: hypothetical protein VH061_04650 [Solirubrobacteraceae bacterium]|nr:hypothetical protein [Solirubrobacteraceae bacterium]